MENEKANKKHQKQTIEMQLIQQRYKPALKTDIDVEFLDATNILKELSADDNFFRSNIQSIGKALKHLGFIQEGKYNEKKKYQQKGYYLKRF